ncbi:MAG TPA: ATP-binding protein [Nitrospira sp.]|nr:ATP-binding protein [Nitrospira sp.]
MNPTRYGRFLPAVLLLCFAIAVGLGLHALGVLRAVLVSERGADLARAAAQAADTLDRVLFERFGDIQVFANDRILLQGSRDEKEKRLQEYRRLYWYYSWIGVADASGRLVAATDLSVSRSKNAESDESSGSGVSADQRDWFEIVRQTGKIHLAEARPSGESGGVMAVGFSAPILGPHGEFQGAVATQVPLENLRAILQQEGALRYREEAFDWLLLDSRGVIISEKEQANGMTGGALKEALPSVVRAAADRSQSGFVEELHQRRQVPVVTGYARTRGYNKFPGFDWTLLVRLDRDRAYAPINRLIWTVGGVGLLLVAPLTGFGIWAARRVAQEQRDLLVAQRDLAESIQISEERARALHSLVGAVREVTASPELDRLLEQILHGAREVTGARYAALGIVDEAQGKLARFITSGMDEATKTAIGALPTGRGILGLLSHQEGALRLKNLMEHQAAIGFPSHHPAMRSFLGVSIRTHERVFGRIYLTEKQGADEFTQLDEEMIIALASHAGKAIDQTLLLQQVQRAENQLRQVNEELIRSNADLQQFAYVASHDLQEPLRMVASYTQLLAKRYKGKLDADADEFIAYAVDGATRMQRLINDLLAYSRVTSQAKAFELVDCNQLLEGVLSTLRLAIEESRAVVTRDALPKVMADSGQLAQLFQNLVSNAIKFHGAEPPSVHVAAERRNDEWLFSVRDNGIGVDPQFADRIFVIFQRLHDREEYPGTGIGLALCKKIVERHGGNIWVESQPGRGATFFFTIPIEQRRDSMS